MNIACVWKQVLKPEFDKLYMKKLGQFLENEYQVQTIYPSRSDIFRALQLTDYDNVKVCIIAQDPYHGPGQANGIAFAVHENIRMPPSLENINKELKRDLGVELKSRNLEYLAEQGVLLLNTVLTVRHKSAGSHRGQGWELFTNEIIKSLNKRQEPIVFLLWGGFAQGKELIISNSTHKIFKSSHPSPLSAYRGFSGCSHFSKTNEFLISIGKEPIQWGVHLRGDIT